MNKNEIQAKYLDLHNALGSLKDATDKVLFNQQHTQIWADCESKLQARKTELEAKSTLSDIENIELKELRVMFPISISSRDLATEIDILDANIKKVAQSAGVTITPLPSK